MNIAEVVEFQTREGTIIEQFLNGIRKQSESTYNAYKTDIAQMFEYLFDKDYTLITQKELNSINGFKLQKYFDMLYNKAKSGEIKCSNTTINRKQSSIKQLIRYLKAINIITEDISYLELIKSLPDDTESIEYMPNEVALQYANWVLKYEKHKAYEKHMLIRMAIDTGLRLGELLSLRWNQFTVDGDIVIIKGRGKGNKKWVEKISYEYLYKPLAVMKTKDNDKVFSLSRKNVQDMMTRAKKALGHEDRNYTFHSFRKTAVTNTYRQTGNLRDAQKKARHSSLTTTQIYLEDEEYKMTGLISLGGDQDPCYYHKVSHEELLQALGEMPQDFLFILNMKLKQLKNK